MRRIRPEEGDRLRAARLAALTDQPSEATITLARTQRFPDQHWADAAETNASGGLQATFFAVTPDEEVVGLVGAYGNQGGTVNLVGLWSAPGFRDVGVAGALLDEVRA